VGRDRRGDIVGDGFEEVIGNKLTENNKTMMTIERLRDFCSVDETRWELLSPFTQGEHSFATDGRLVVRVPRLEGVSTEPRKADAAKLFLPDRGRLPVVEFPPRWQALPELWDECQSCGGTAKQKERVKCAECDGTGSVTCGECGNDHDCGKCRGEGDVPGRPEVPCEDCDGLGKIEVCTPVLGMPGEVGFNDRYLRRVFSLPGVVMRHDPAEAMEPAYFTFEGGDGLLMPMRIVDEKRVVARKMWGR